MGGGSSWEEFGSTLACKGFERGSENAKKGNGAKKVDFNSSCWEEYAGLVRDALDSDSAWITPKKAEGLLSRTPLAVVARAKKVKSECQKFEGLINVVKAAKPTGDPKEEDIQLAALAIYNKDGTVADMYRYLRGDEEPSKPFPFTREFAWYKETNSALLLKKRACRQIQSPSSGDDVLTPAAAVNEAVGKTGFKRPLGNKKAGSLAEQNKAIAKGSAGIASLAKAAHKRAKLGKEALAIEKKKADTEKMKVTMQLFAMEGCCPVMRAQVFKKLQEKALADTMSSESKLCTAGASDSDSDGARSGKISNDFSASATCLQSDDEVEEASPHECDDEGDSTEMD